MRNLVVLGCVLALLGGALAPGLAAAATDVPPAPTAPIPAAVVPPPVAAPAPAPAPAAAAATAPAKDTPDHAGLTDRSLRAILKLFVLAVVLESALALLFNWRPFLMTFDGRGVKSLISFAASLGLVFTFGIDVVGDLMADFSATAQATVFSQIVTAMVIAGGSSGVNNLLRSLGFRPVTRAEDLAPKPPPDEPGFPSP